MAEEFARIRVTLQRDYIVPVQAGQTYNGWTVEELIQAWFRDFDINRCHVARDHSRLGGGDIVLAVEQVPFGEQPGDPVAGT